MVQSADLGPARDIPDERNGDMSKERCVAWHIKKMMKTVVVVVAAAAVVMVVMITMTVQQAIMEM